MKANKFLTLILIAVTGLGFVSCVQDDDYEVPSSLGNEENQGLANVMQKIDDGSLTMVTIDQVKNLFVSGNDAVQIVSDIVVKGYVSSSDVTGNFYKEFFIQDAPQNPTTAIRIELNQVDSYNQFNIGREVYIMLKGLYVGEAYTGDGVITIGGNVVDGEIDAMTANQIPLHLFRSATTETMVPLELRFSEISEAHIGILITVNDAQFPEALEGKSYVSPEDDYETDLTLESCDGFGYSNFLLETSSFASFKQEPLPMGGGSITGVVNKTYNGSDLIIVLNHLEDVQMDGSRCTPLDINDFNVIFQDDFSGGIGAFTAYSVTGAQGWQQTSFGNPGPSAQMNGYSGGPVTNEDWLITPAIDLSGVSNTILFFDTVKRYAGPDLEVYMSTDYAGGNPNTSGTWTLLSPALDSNINSWDSWTNSGNVDVSSADGQTLFIGFKYTSTSSAASTYELDNVTVLGL
ncbi:MAG TPA: DUF5689 domain-containing protein [Flavobacteriaceae bacterium]|nr:DUF5689 domain-containing protein [Flavobacteriaceae bacterium]